MGFWFSYKDSDEVCFEHCVGKHTPDSIREEAKMELRQRGYTIQQIDKYILEHEDWIY